MRTRTRNLKRLLSLALCLSMVTGLLPVTVLAANAPTITTDTLEAATVDVYYETTLTATASAQNGELSWSATGLPNGLALTDNGGGTATLDGIPTEAGEVTFTVTVTETIPAAEPEDPAEGTEPDQVTPALGLGSSALSPTARGFTVFFFLMIRRPPRSTPVIMSTADSKERPTPSPWTRRG